MVRKDKIRQLTEALLNSARARGTNQGVLVFEKVLESLDESSDDEAIDVLKRLNGALVGIEAHGDLTDEEFRFVRELRKIEEMV